MDKLEYKGQTYLRTNARWTDTRRIAVPETLQRILNSLYLETLDYSGYSVAELIAEGDKFKESSSYESAIAFYEKAIDLCDQRTLQYVLPRITSCYRLGHHPHKVIELFSAVKQRWGEAFITPVLLTSVAAAYCDLKEYENALRCCRWAYKNFDEFDANLSNVWARIKKESGLE